MYNAEIIFPLLQLKNRYNKHEADRKKYIQG